MLVFSEDSFDSVDSLATIYDDICKLRDQRPMVVVANKCDLQKDPQKVETGRDMAKHWNVPFFEVSAKTGVNVAEAYSELIRQIRAFKSAEPPEGVNPKKKTGNCYLQ